MNHRVTIFAATSILSLVVAPQLQAQLPAGNAAGPGGTANPAQYNPSVYAPGSYAPSTGQRIEGGGPASAGLYANQRVSGGNAYGSSAGGSGGILYNRNQLFGIPGVTGGLGVNDFRMLGTGFTNLDASGLASRYSQPDSFIANERGNYINPQTVGNPQLYLSPLVTSQPENTPRPISTPTANFGAYRNLVIDRNPQTLFTQELPAREGLLTGQRTNTESAYNQNSIPFSQQQPTPQNAAPIPPSSSPIQPLQIQPTPLNTTQQQSLEQTTEQKPVPFYYEAYKEQQEKEHVQPEQNADQKPVTE
ncbi:hypothetical protein KS4_34880 [Poriferisphaera corsica]|uniref:Uncharacterized protein n=1 Tax=Poriferisphaera corsica TaxID=2528020 RepID=A0A517YYX1_9BACT|nr:hypothetical protein [Poriferisphaera corsica]QDU35407.1 hypothetical protein KS4_34880 [Poriferisphaera corsica]